MGRTVRNRRTRFDDDYEGDYGFKSKKALKKMRKARVAKREHVRHLHDVGGDGGYYEEEEESFSDY